MEEFFDMLVTMVQGTFVGSPDEVEASCEKAKAEWKQLKALVRDIEELVAPPEFRNDLRAKHQG